MPLSTFNLPWLNHNSQRAYPLFEGASHTDISDSFTVPDSMILALYFPVHAGLDVEPDKFFLRSVGIFATGLSISIGYDDGSVTPPIVATTVIAFSTHTENDSYALPGVNDFDDSVGKIVIGDISDLRALPPGQYLFTPAAGMLDTDVIRPIIRGVSAIVLVNNGERSVPLTGDIEIVAGNRVRLTPSTIGGVNYVRIDAIDGEGLNDACVCEGETDAPCIKTVNGVGPDINGNLDVLGNSCLEIGAISNGIKLNDICSDPCCGCEELERVTRDQERLSDATTTLTNFVTRLEGQVTTMSMNVLGSRLNDTGCGG